LLLITAAAAAALPPVSPALTGTPTQTMPQTTNPDKKVITAELTRQYRQPCCPLHQQQQQQHCRQPALP
jgi:hypothetical protein